MDKNMKYVSTKSNMPQKPHWAIIVFTSVYIPGDERSRSAPGHGYPAHSENVVNYIAFTDEEEWKAEINRSMTSTYGKRDNFIAVHVTPAKIKLETQVSVD